MYVEHSVKDWKKEKRRKKIMLENGGFKKCMLHRSACCIPSCFLSYKTQISTYFYGWRIPQERTKLMVTVIGVLKPLVVPNVTRFYPNMENYLKLKDFPKFS